MMFVQINPSRCVICVLVASICVATICVAEIGAKDNNSKGSKTTVQEFDKVEPQEYPWGWIRWLMNAEIDPDAEMTFGMVYIKPHQETPLHLHPNSEEHLHVLEGSCEHLVGNRWVKLKAGDTVRIPKNVRHRARTTGEACRAVIVYNTGKRQMIQLGAGEPR